MNATHAALCAIAQKRIDEVFAVGASRHQATITVNAHDVLALCNELERLTQRRAKKNAKEAV